MHNKAMQRKVQAKKCLDVRVIGEPVPDDPRLFELKTFVDGKDYADVSTESWIWSIGKRKSDGRIFASTDSRFYMNPDFICLWLR